MRCVLNNNTQRKMHLDMIGNFFTSESLLKTSSKCVHVYTCLHNTSSFNVLGYLGRV